MYNIEMGLPFWLRVPHRDKHWASHPRLLDWQGMMHRADQGLLLNERERTVMIFAAEDVYVDFTQPTDIDDLVGIYNSHPAFIECHLNRHAVTSDWMAKEVAATRAAGFWSCKVVGKFSDQVLGLIDVRVDTETYLSLMMIHQSYAHQGIGQQVYDALEDYIRLRGSRVLRIDVVTGYDEHVQNFWMRNGFRVVKDITLDWNGLKHAVVMMLLSL